MKISGQIIWKELLQAFLLHYKSNVSTLITFYVITIFFGIGGFGGIILSVTEDFPIQYSLPFLLIGLCPILIRYVLLPIQVKNIFRAQKEWNSPFEYEFTETHLMLNTLYNRNSFPFTEIVKWKENKQVCLLYYTFNCFYVIPKRFFTDPQQIDTLRSYIPKKPTQKAKALQKPILISRLIAIAIAIIIIVVVFLFNYR
jgi:hypothetical protein